MPRYVEIANDLRRRIRTGEFPVGTLLPPITPLETEYGVSMTPIRMAQDILRKEGLLRMTQGRGVEVIALPPGNIPELLATIKTAVAQLETALAAKA